jgi:hypothetical protein
MRQTVPSPTLKVSLSLTAVWLAVLCLPGGAATASEKARIKSRFTTIELKTCDAQPKGGTPATGWVCKGLAGYPVYVGVDDARQAVGFGAGAKSSRAAAQSLQAESTIFDGARHRPTVEWRFRRSEGRDVPYATIMRFYTSSGASRGEVLIVTKVTATDACQMARIDARANPDPLILARSVADELSAAFDCATDQPRTVGASGRSPM